MQALKGAGTLLMGIAGVLALAFIGLLYIKGLLWVSQNALDYLNTATIIALVVCVFVILPLSLLRSTRVFSVYGFFISSVIFGVSTWVLGFLVTYQHWGVTGLFVGLFLGGVGVVPIGMLASAFNAAWPQVGDLILGVVLTFGARAIVFLLAQMIDRDKAGIISNSPSNYATPTSRSLMSYATEKWTEWLRLDGIKRQQIILTASIVPVLGGLAIRGAFDPSRHDYQQAMVNFQYHPIAFILGVLAPSIIFTPIGYWIFGWSLRRNAARSKNCEHCAEKIKAGAKVCRYCGRDVAAAGQADLGAERHEKGGHGSGTSVKSLEPTRATLAADAVSVTGEALSRNSWQLSTVALVIACTFGLVVYGGLNFNRLRDRFAGQDFDPDKYLASHSTQQKTKWPGTPWEEHQGIDAYNRGDYLTAMQLFRPLANQADAPAQFYVGWMYANGQGVPKSDAEAARWYRLAAGQGLARAQYYLGLMYGNGQGAPRDDTVAVILYRKAAEQGDGEAQLILGYMFAEGRGVPRNDGEALRWYKRAADQGSDLAQTSLGLMYYEGSGVQKNEAEAMKWWRKAADQGEALAQYYLGFMYHEGRGVQQNYVLAHMWYDLAAKQGNQDATRNQNLVAHLMTPAQIVEAQRLAGAWKSKRVFSDAEIGLLPDVSAPKHSLGPLPAFDDIPDAPQR